MTEHLVPFALEDVVSILKSKPETNITFYKLNNVIREMKCTLHPETLNSIVEARPDDVVPFSTDYDENQVRVWDLEKKGWRSFILQNLITID